MGTWRKKKLIFTKWLTSVLRHSTVYPILKQYRLKRKFNRILSTILNGVCLTAIMQNLLENAIKYSSKSSPFVVVRVFSNTGVFIYRSRR